VKTLLFGSRRVAVSNPPAPWLPVQPAVWSAYTVEAELRDPGSMLRLYRSALALRRSEPGFRGSRDGLRWLESPEQVLAFQRGDENVCVVNLSAEPIALPAHHTTLLTSGPLTDDGLLPPDCAAWLRVS
jgi:alpha-glucosidase